ERLYHERESTLLNGAGDKRSLAGSRRTGCLRGEGQEGYRIATERSADRWELEFPSHSEDSASFTEGALEADSLEAGRKGDKRPNQRPQTPVYDGHGRHCTLGVQEEISGGDRTKVTSESPPQPGIRGNPEAGLWEAASK